MTSRLGNEGQKQADTAKTLVASTYERVVEKMRDSSNVPVMPIACQKFVQLVDAGDLAGPEVVKAVSADPVLTTVILKTASSASYGRQNVSNIATALTVIGAKTARTLAQIGILRSASARPSPSSKWEDDKFISHSLFVAILAKYLHTLAERKHKIRFNTTSDEAFSAGILHEVPMRLLSVEWPGLFEKIYLQAVSNQRSLAQQFHVLFGRRFGEASQDVFRSMGLSDVLIALVCQLDSEVAETGPINDLRVLRLADILATANKYPVIAWSPPPLQIESLLEGLPFSAEEIEEALTATTQVCRDALLSFNVRR